MRILVLGAGALGGLVGANLTRAGEDVTLLEVNTARARLLDEAGLLISRVGEEEACVPVHVVSALDGLAPFDLVFIAVKAYETADAVRSVLPVCTETTLFLSLQNGVGNAETVATLVPAERVLCGITYHSIQHAGPRRLHYRVGIKPIQIAPLAGGSNPAIERVAEIFRRAGMATDVVSNVQHAIWQKLLHNAVVNPTSALTGLTCREMLVDPDLMAFMRELAAEIITVMRAKGIPIVDEEDPFRPIIGSLKALAKNRPSMWQDLSRAKRTEVDALNGAVVAEAARLGLVAPHNAAIVHFIHSRERQKFLIKQEIAVKLGLEDGRATLERGTPQVVGKAIRFGPDAGMPSGAPPLESTRRLKELVHNYYLELERASRERRGARVAACSGLAPVEVVRALGLLPYFPENHAALIAATRQSGRYIARATAEGFSQFANSAMRADIGALLEGSSPLVSAHGVAGPPRPDVVVYSTNTGHELLRWFEFYGTHYGVPVVGLHPSPALHDLEQMDVNAAVDQLLRLVERLETVTGDHLEMDRLADVVGLTAQAGALWDDILGLARATPAPLTFFDALVHLAPMVLLRGTPEAVAYYKMLKAELEERVAQGIGAVPDETHRFYWDGPPIWSALRPLSRLFAEHGAAVVASTFCGVFALPGLDRDNPVESMARTYMGVFGNRSEEYKTAYLAAKFDDYAVDAAIYHDCRTTPEASHVRYGLARRVEHLTGVPGFVVEADAYDSRLFSAERVEWQLSNFVEQRMERVAAH
ncbi:MAG TPA: 2-dehydropantoate 2-reductase [Gemmatimonadaceae bacterium]